MKTFHYYKMYQSGVSMEIEKLLLNSFAKCLSHADLKRIGYFFKSTAHGRVNLKEFFLFQWRLIENPVAKVQTYKT